MFIRASDGINRICRRSGAQSEAVSKVKRAVVFVALALSILALTLCPGVPPSYAGGSGCSSSTGTNVVTVFPACFTDNVFYGNSKGAISNAASLGIYEVTVTSTTTVAITITDANIVGDYYQVWQSSNAAFTGATPVGSPTPQVHTDKDGALVAPHYNPLWDGTASESVGGYSTGTIDVTLAPGTTYFAVQDLIQDAMGAKLDAPCGGVTTNALITNGCAESSPYHIAVLAGDWSGSGYTIQFAVPTGAPQFGASPVAVAAAAVFLLALVRAGLGRPSRDRAAL